MRLPYRTLKIAGHRVKLKLDPSIDVWGWWDYDKKIILIGKRVVDDPDSLMATLKHEIRHASLDLTGVSHGITAKHQEQIIRCFDEIADPAWAEAELRAKKNAPRNKKHVRKSK